MWHEPWVKTGLIFVAYNERIQLFKFVVVDSFMKHTPKKLALGILNLSLDALKILLLITLILMCLPFIKLVGKLADPYPNWSQAHRESAGIAPLAETFSDPIVQVYSARLYGWRGALGVHSWVAAKRKDADSYTVYQVIGWRKYRGKPPVTVTEDLPDRHWFANQPELLVDIQGEEAGALIDKIEAAVDSYPDAHRYTMWPGPNSNSFVAYIGRQVPELGLELPPTAIGKDFINDGSQTGAFWVSLPSGGFKLSLFGLLGVTAGIEEGLEFNIFSLHFGVDPLDRALLLPGFGRVVLF